MPTFSAYYEFATGPVVALQLRPENDFRLDFDELDALVDRYARATVVIINPNNPDGGPADHGALLDFVRRAAGRVGALVPCHGEVSTLTGWPLPVTGRG